MAEWDQGEESNGTRHEYVEELWELWFMSRPDALLRERGSNELYLLSYKTTGSWDVRKARDIEHDMQGLSEGVEVERRLGEWWHRLHYPGSYKDAFSFDIETRMYQFLKSLAAPPRVHAIRYEHLLKSYRAEDWELSARLGMTVYSQRSHLIRQYVATSTPKKGDGGYSRGDICWAWEFYRPEDNKDSKLAWQNWASRPVDDVKEWINKLDDTQMLMSGEDSTVGLEPRPLGYRSAAQAMGVTREHPLDSVFVLPVTVYRSDDDLRDWFDQTVEQERLSAEGVAAINACSDAGQRRHLMNKYFGMHRSSCEYPGQCAFTKLCFGGPEIKRDPLGSGQFVRREPNHPIEGTQSLVQINNSTTI